MASRLSSKLAAQPPRERNHLRAARAAPPSPRHPPAMRPTQRARSELWAQLKRDAASRPDVDPELILRHHCRFRALCVLAGVPASTPAARTALPSAAVGTALDALAFQHAAFRETVVHALDGKKTGRVECAAYMRAALALGSPGEKLAFMAACHQIEPADAMSADELRELVCDSLDFAENESRADVAVVADRIVAELVAESGLAPGAKLRLHDLRALAERARAPARADELDAWGMLDASLVDLAALQHSRLEALVARANARDLTIS